MITYADHFGTQMTPLGLEIRGHGGCAWGAYVRGRDEDGYEDSEFCGVFEAGDIDDSGQWKGDDEEVERVAREVTEARFGAAIAQLPVLSRD